jgi:excisionase family DNA binding protein
MWYTIWPRQSWEVAEMAGGRRLWSVKEAAEFLGQSEETIRRKLASGEIPGFRVGGRGASWRVYADELEQLVSADREESDRRWREHVEAREVEEAERRRRMAGVVGGRTGTPEADRAFADEVAREWRRSTLDALTRRAVLEEAAGAVDEAGAGLEGEFADLEDEAAIEERAQELARTVRRAERIRKRAEEILEEDVE